LQGRLLVVAFEGWNDAGEAASGAVRTLKELLDLYPIAEIDAERYFDYQFNRPTLASDDDGNRMLVWPSVVTYGPTSVLGQRAVPADPSTAVPTPAVPTPAVPTPADESAPADDDDPEVGANNASNIYLLLGTEPSRNWKSFTAEIMATIAENSISGIVFLGAMLADVPHTRPISVFVSSEDATIRRELGVERSTYEGPVGILSVLGEAAEKAGIPTVSIWASVPHYVHNAPSPKATLAIIDKLEEIIDVVIPRGELVDESAAWETGIDALASEDDDMATYIAQLEAARDTVDSPEASGEAIAQEFERYLRRRDGKGDGRGGSGQSGPGIPPKE
jgi:hypothetical protein